MGILDSFLEKKYGKPTPPIPGTLFISGENGELKEIPSMSPHFYTEPSVVRKEEFEKLEKENTLLKRNIKRNKWRSASKRRR